jgi:hypothetical protein
MFPLILAFCSWRADFLIAQPVVHFARTLNLLEHIQPGVVPVYGKRIRGFRTLVESSELKRAISFGPWEDIVTGTRAGDPPCPFVVVDTRRYPSVFFDRVDWVGNVPGADISEDDDCECETHLAFIHFVSIWIYYEDGSVVHMPAARLPGRHVLCPNLMAGHLLGGDRNFSGAVTTTLSITLRVADDNMALLADIQYRIIATSP